MDDKRAVDVVYPDFSKAFYTAFQDILIGKLTTYGLHKWTVKQIEN